MSTENGTNGYLFGHCRVSTADRNQELHVDALTAAGCDRILTDHASGKLEHRSALDAMLNCCGLETQSLSGASTG